MEQKKLIRKTFNDEFIKFVDEVRRIFPKDNDIKKASMALELLKRTKPSMIIEVWKTNIVDVYEEEIENGRIDYFLEKDYKEDVEGSENDGDILTSINRLRQPIKSMSDTNKETSMKYIQQLTKLCQLYFQ